MVVWNKIRIDKYDPKFKLRLDARHWCGEQFENNKWKYKPNISKFGIGVLSCTFSFKNKTDYILFRLTWID